MKKELLIIAASHGNERLGLEVINLLVNEGLGKYFDIRIGNPRALAKNFRFIDCDLNRSYPGNLNSQLYEERRARLNLDVASQYKYVIDIHEASAGYDDFIIAPRDCLPLNFPLQWLTLNKVLLWPDPQGPLCSIIENGVEIEFGSKNRNRREMIGKASAVVRGFILASINSRRPTFVRKEIYRVYGTIPSASCNTKLKLNDFKLTKMGKEEFYPLLVNQYLDLGILCYKMRKES